MLSDKSDFSYEMENNKINHQSIIAAKLQIYVITFPLFRKIKN